MYQPTCHLVINISHPNRYYAIVHPLKAQYLCTLSRAKKTVLAAWAMAFILATPILFVQVYNHL